MSDNDGSIRDRLRSARLGSVLPLALIVLLSSMLAGFDAYRAFGGSYSARSVVIFSVELVLLCLLSVEAAASIVRRVRPAVVFGLIGAFVAWRWVSLDFPVGSIRGAPKDLDLGVFLALMAGVAWRLQRTPIPPPRRWRTVLGGIEQVLAAALVTFGVMFLIVSAVRAVGRPAVADAPRGPVPPMRVQVGDSVE